MGGRASQSLTARRRRRYVERPVVAIGLAVAAMTGAFVGNLTPASAALNVRVVNTDGDGVSSRNAPSVNARNGYGAPEGAVVTTVCWTWGDAVGPYSNRLWWLIAYSGRQFYAADRYLSTPNVANRPPPGEPQCGSPSQGSPPPPPQGSSPCLQGGCPASPASTGSASSRAINWARAQVGRTVAAPSDAAAYPNANWAPGPRGEWSGDCIKFVHRAYALAGVNVPRGNAADVYRVYLNQRRIRQGTPPAGALVFWDTARPYGHVALSVGGGQVIGTRGLDGDHRPIRQYSTGVIPNYLGWVMP